MNDKTTKGPSTGMSFPPVLIKWLAGLPEPHRTREIMIAERNLRRIANWIYAS